MFSHNKYHFALRTDENFINHKYNDYQTGETILNNIPNFKLIGCI